MTPQDKNLFTELALTCSLLIAAVFLLKPAVFWQYQLFLIGGLGVGFAFSWYNRKGVFKAIKYFNDGAIVIIIAWIGYRIFKSTFLYKEVIAILIQGVIILEVIFSFDLSAPGKTDYIRLLSLLIFMTSPVFAIAYSLPLAIVYLLVWLVIFRFQFTGFLKPVQEKGARRYYSPATSLVCFLVVLLLTWFIFSNVYLGRVKKGMLLLDEDLQDVDSESEKESKLEDKFYSLQDDLQNRITDLALKSGSYEERRQLIYLLSVLVKETDKTMDVDKAEIGLIDILKREAPGLEGTEKAITLTREYLDKKNYLSLKKNKEKITNIFQKHPLGIVDKIKILSLANKMQQAYSYPQLKDDSRALQRAIQSAPLSKDVQGSSGGFGRSISNLKAFELYRRKMRDLDQRSQSLGEEIEKNIGDIASDVKYAEGPDDFKQTAKKIRQLKNDPRISKQESGKDALKNLDEALRIKLDLFFAEKSENVRKDASQRQDLKSQAEEFDRKMDEAGNSRDHQEFLKEFAGLCQQNKDNNLGLAKELGELLKLKTESFKQTEKDKIDDLTNKDIFSEARKEMLEAIEAMEEKESSRDLEKRSEELSGRIKELERKNNLPPEKVDELLKAAAEFKNLLEAKLQAEAELKKKELSEKDFQKTDYLDQLQQAIEDSALNIREKEMLKALSEQLLKAQNLSQLEDVKEALEDKISSLTQGEGDQDRKSLLDSSENISADLEGKIDGLEDVATEQIQQLQEYLKKMRLSQDSRELENNSKEFKKALKSDIAQDGQKQAKMLGAVQKLKEALNGLLEKKAALAVKPRGVNKINEKIKQAAKIKQQFLESEALADISEKIEKLSLQDAKKAQDLKEKLEQLRKSNAPEETEKIISDLKDISDSENTQEDKNSIMRQGSSPEWKVYIISSSFIVTQGVTLPLKVIAVYQDMYVKELTSDVEWFSTDPQVAWVDDLNFLYPLIQGKTKIRAVYKGAASKDMEFNVVGDMDLQTKQAIQQELGD